MAGPRNLTGRYLSLEAFYRWSWTMDARIGEMHSTEYSDKRSPQPISDSELGRLVRAFDG
jgi:hypothetical protein